MKQLFAASALFLVFGLVSFVYRSALERPAPLPEGFSEPICPMDALVCPDGTTVGRGGPFCDFAPCPAPVSGATTSPELAPMATGTATVSPPSAP